jgi:hypothetical protein
LLEHFMADYLLFGIPAPSWAVRALPHRPPHQTAMHLKRPWSLGGENPLAPQ